MNAFTDYEPRARTIDLPSRGAMAVLDFGPDDRPVDIVFSHANGFNARTYRSILAPLAARLRLLAPPARPRRFEAAGRRRRLAWLDRLRRGSRRPAGG